MRDYVVTWSYDEVGNRVKLCERDGIAMPSRLNVKQNASGQWEILKEGHRRAAVTASTERAAVSTARKQVLQEGGGEVRVIDRTGKIARSTSVKVKAGGRAAVKAAGGS